MPDSSADTAALLEQLGLYWIPVPLGTKVPTERRWQEPRRRPPPTGPTNIGVLLTRYSGLVDIDLDSVPAVRAATVLVRPSVGVVRYGRRTKAVSHVLVREDGEYHGPRRVTDPDARSLVLEVRTDRQQSLVPPSVHPSGEQLVWVDDPRGLAELAPAGTAEAVARRVAAAAVLAGGWEPGNRHDTALALAGWLTRLGWPEDDVVTFCRAVAVAAGDEEVADRVAAAAATLARSSDHDTTGFPTLTALVGQARAELAARLLVPRTQQARGRQKDITLEDVLQAVAKRDDVRVVPPDVIAWDGTRWRRGPFGLARPAVVAALEELGAPAAWLNRTTSISASVAAGAVPELVVDDDDLDAVPRVLGLPDGTVVDLATGDVRAARREEFVTRSVAVAYDPGTDCRLLVELLEAATGSRDAVVYLQLLAGATLLGEPAKLAVVIHGPTNTGKTLFLVDAMAAALGSYAVQLDPQKVLRAGAERAELWLSRAVGCRALILSEPSREYRLDVQLLKVMTGRGRVTVRRLYSQPVEVVPTWTVWVDTNWLPQVDDDDEATWSRIRAVQFRHVVRPARDDPRFNPRFLEVWRSEAPRQFLAWAVQGAVKVVQTAWDPALIDRAQADDTDEWREVEREDSVSEFVATALRPDPTTFTSRREVWDAYCEWAANRPAAKRVSRGVLYEAVRAAGVDAVVLHGERGFKCRVQFSPGALTSTLAPESTRWFEN